MHFELSDEQRELAATIGALLAKRGGVAGSRQGYAQARGYDPELWQVLVEQIGVTALCIPEEFDGVGAGLVESGLVLSELGRALTPSPMLATTLATVALRLAGADDVLAEIAGGSSATVLQDGDALTLDGDTAARIFVIREERLGEVTKFAASTRTAMDQTLRLAEVEIEDVRDLGPLDVAAFEAIAAALITAVQVGGMEGALALTVAYTKEREQFGRQIGSFQAIKHRLADCYVRSETSRSACWAALWTASDYLDRHAAGTLTETARAELLQRSATAKVWCTESFNQIASETVQLHGGIAITWEHDAHLYFKRAQATAVLFGQAHAQRTKIDLTYAP